jgi:hypothetical protein
MPEVKKILEVALPEFNRIRVPEIEATLKEVTDDGFKVFFSGSFCHTCGYYDYFEDLLYLLLDDYGVKTEIKGIEQEDEGDYVNFLLAKER